MLARIAVVAVAAILAVAGAAMADAFGAGANQFNIDFVPISGATNPTVTQAVYTGGYGIVNHDYRMGTFDVTNDQWDKFTASLGVPVTGADGGYNTSSYWTGANVPVNNVSWYEAAQFVNWLNTSTNHQAAYKFTGTQGTSDYTLATWSPADVGYNSGDPYRNSNAFYYLPTESEWVKAAYWNGMSLQTYATKNGGIPVPGVDSNYNGVLGHLWNVGSGRQELNGTYDMMGNVFQWEESPYTSGDYGTASYRGARGGSYFSYSFDYTLASSYRGYSGSPRDEVGGLGFRVASDAVPEPLTLSLLGVGGLALLRRRRS